MPWMIVVIFFTLLDTLSSEVACISLADIYWNATNPIFRIDNTDHIIDVNRGREAFEYDQVNIICPVYPRAGTRPDATDEDEEAERYIIYNVSKEEYDSCRITNPNPRIIAQCDKPNTYLYFTITFRSFTPQPGGLEFLPGNDYYFISTSTGSIEGLHQRVGGRCATHNMKVIFKVCCSPTKGAPSGNTIPSDPASAAPNASLPAASAPPSRQQNALDSPPLLEPRPPSEVKPGTPAAPLVTSVPRWLRPTLRMRPYELPIEDEMDRSAAPSDRSRETAARPPQRDRAKKDGLVNSARSWGRRLAHPGAYFLCALAHLFAVALQCR